MVLFKDLNKSSTDLLTRDFAHSRPLDVEFKHSAKNPIFTQNAFVNKTGSFDAQSSAKYTFPCGSLEAKLGTSSALLEAQYKVSYLPGLTLVSRLDRKFHAKGASDKAELSAEYLAANGTHFNFTVQPLNPYWTACTVACVPSNGNGTARIGAEFSGSTDLRTLKYSLGGSYSLSTSDLLYSASFRTLHSREKPLGKLTANIYAQTKKVNASQYGVEVSHEPSEYKTKMAFVGMWPLEQQGTQPGTTFLKAKMTHEGHFAASLTHKASDFVTATLGAKINASKGMSSTDVIKYGIKLNVSA